MYISTFARNFPSKYFSWSRVLGKRHVHGHVPLVSQIALGFYIYHVYLHVYEFPVLDPISRAT